jgi:Holliday junction resolvasome RuvABC endonuclease subunit
VAVTSGPGVVPRLYRIRPRTRGHERLAYILAELERLAEGCDLAVLEGLAFGARGNALLDLAGLQWMIRHLLWNLHLPYAVVSPYERAKFATGHAGADKDEVLAAAIHRFGVTVGITSNDTADALWFAAMGCERLCEPIVELPAAQRQVIYAIHAAKGKRGTPKILWPAMGAPPVQEVLA